MDRDIKLLMDSGVTEYVVLQTLLEGMKLLGKESITIDELQKLIETIKNRK